MNQHRKGGSRFSILRIHARKTPSDRLDNYRPPMDNFPVESGMAYNNPGSINRTSHTFMNEGQEI
jgi:hypothetical protein